MSSHGLILGIIPAFKWKKWRKVQESLLRIVSGRATIQSWHIPNASLKHYLPFKPICAVISNNYKLEQKMAAVEHML
jgi:hypothetical protein